MHRWPADRDRGVDGESVGREDGDRKGMCTGHRAQRVRCLGVTYMGLRLGERTGWVWQSGVYQRLAEVVEGPAAASV